MTKVLLTGASGLIGAAILRTLLAEGHDVATLGRAEHAPLPGIEHYRLDLIEAAPAELRMLARRAACDRLIHAAWYTNHADYLTADVNRRWLDGSIRLIDAFHEETQGRIIGLGTCVEYALDGGRCIEDATPLRPDTLYGVCKNALSSYLLAIPNTAWARIFFVYGPGDRAGRLVPHLIERARNGSPVSVRFGGLRRDYIHIDDLAAQIVALACSDVTGPVNTASGHAVRLSDIVEAAAAAAGRPELARPNAWIDPAQPPVIEADMKRYRDAVGPIPSRSLLDGLRPLFGA